jgi:hypothetical protein
MNVTFLRLKPVVKELRLIRDQLERLAECWEAELAEKRIYLRPPKTDTSGPPPTLSYTDEEEDFIRETVDRYRREDVQRDDNDEALRKD